MEAGDHKKKRNRFSDASSEAIVTNESINDYQTLQSFLQRRRNNRLSPNEIMLLAMNLIACLNTADPPVVYGDISPYVILVKSKFSDGTLQSPSFADFHSIFTLVTKDSLPMDSNGHTASDTSGTHHPNNEHVKCFLAPESLTLVSSSASDLWSLGATLFHLALGEGVYLISSREGKARQKTIQAWLSCSWSFENDILQGLLPTLTTEQQHVWHGQLNPWIKEFIGQCLQVKPDERPTVKQPQESESFRLLEHCLHHNYQALFSSNNSNRPSSFGMMKKMISIEEHEKIVKEYVQEIGQLTADLTELITLKQLQAEQQQQEQQQRQLMATNGYASRMMKKMKMINDNDNSHVLPAPPALLPPPLPPPPPPTARYPPPVPSAHFPTIETAATAGAMSGGARYLTYYSQGQPIGQTSYYYHSQQQQQVSQQQQQDQQMQIQLQFQQLDYQRMWNYYSSHQQQPTQQQQPSQPSYPPYYHHSLYNSSNSSSQYQQPTVLPPIAPTLTPPILPPPPPPSAYIHTPSASANAAPPALSPGPNPSNLAPALSTPSSPTNHNGSSASSTPTSASSFATALSAYYDNHPNNHSKRNSHSNGRYDHHH